MAFCLALSAGLVIPLYPLFIASLGATSALVGIVTSFRGIPNVFLRAPTGALSDRFGRKPLMIMGALLYTSIPLIYTQLENAWHLIPFVTLQGIGMACLWPPTYAHVADITDPENRGKAIGGFGMIFGAAYTFGMTISGFLIERISHTNTFRVASFIAAIGLAIAIFGIKDVRSSETSDKKSNETRPSFVDNLRILLKKPSLLLAAAAMLASSVALTTTTTFFPLYGVEIAGLSESSISTAMGINSAISTIMRLPGGAMADKIEKKLALSIAILLCLLPIASIPLTVEYFPLLFLLIILGVGEGMAQSIPIVLITSLSDIPKGFSVGLAQMFGFFGKAVVPTMSGFVSEGLGLKWAFWLGALISGPPFIAALLVSQRME